MKKLPMYKIVKDKFLYKLCIGQRQRPYCFTKFDRKEKYHAKKNLACFDLCRGTGYVGVCNLDTLTTCES